jgi:Holliday junction resolvase
MMEMEDNSHQFRSITFNAATQLKSAGYESVRVAGSGRLFDLIAWKEDTVLFLVLKRSRATGISGYTDEVFHLVDLVKTGKLPGVVQFWIYRSQNWVRYQIMPGGALPIQEAAL